MQKEKEVIFRTHKSAHGKKIKLIYDKLILQKKNLFFFITFLYNTEQNHIF